MAGIEMSERRAAIMPVWKNVRREPLSWETGLAYKYG